MKHDEFIEEVQARARLSSPADAEKATRATLEVLGERLAGGEPENLAAQLPAEIGRHLEENEGAERLTLDEFLARISERSGADLPDAVHQTRAVISVVTDAVTEGEVEKVRGQLPREYQPLFESGSEGQLETP